MSFAKSAQPISPANRIDSSGTEVDLRHLWVSCTVLTHRDMRTAVAANCHRLTMGSDESMLSYLPTFDPRTLSADSRRDLLRFGAVGLLRGITDCGHLLSGYASETRWESLATEVAICDCARSSRIITSHLTAELKSLESIKTLSAEFAEYCLEADNAISTLHESLDAALKVKSFRIDPDHGELPKGKKNEKKREKECEARYKLVEVEAKKAVQRLEELRRKVAKTSEEVWFFDSSALAVAGTSGN